MTYVSRRRLTAKEASDAYHYWGILGTSRAWVYLYADEGHPTILVELATGVIAFHGELEGDAYRYSPTPLEVT